MNKCKTTFLLIFLLFSTSFLFAQETEEKPSLGKTKSSNSVAVPLKDSTTKEQIKMVPITQIEQDTIPTDTSDFSTKTRNLFDNNTKNAPLKAALFSIVPGGGQAFNRKFWKLPIVYAGMGVAGYFVVKNTKEHRIFRDAYFDRVDEDPMTVDSFPFYTNDGLKLQRDSKLRDLEIAYIGMVAVYVLSGVDAFVDAHLKTFDISDDLSMRVSPKLMINQGMLQPGFGVGLTFVPRVRTSASSPGF